MVGWLVVWSVGRWKENMIVKRGVSARSCGLMLQATPRELYSRGAFFFSRSWTRRGDIKILKGTIPRLQRRNPRPAFENSLKTCAESSSARDGALYGGKGDNMDMISQERCQASSSSSSSSHSQTPSAKSELFIFRHWTMPQCWKIKTFGFRECTFRCRARALYGTKMLPFGIFNIINEFKCAV